MKKPHYTAGNVFTAEPPPSICATVNHLLRGELDGTPIRAVGVCRFLSWPIARRGELIAWLESLPVLEAGSALLGAVWDCGEIRRALKRKDGERFLQHLDPAVAALLR